MISIGENKASLCKGDFHPAALYKGDKKIAGYSTEEFEGEGIVTLTNCYNDKVYDVNIGDNTGVITVRGKNILDMSKQTVSQGYYLDSSGNTQNSNSRFIKISPIKVAPLTQYTISIGSKHNLYTIWFYKYSYDVAEGGIGKLAAYNLKKVTFTTPANCTYIRVTIDSGGTAIPSDLEWAMLEKGKGDDIFEPYIVPQTIPFENGELTADIPTFKGTTVIEIESDIAATISGKYKRTEE